MLVLAAATLFLYQPLDALGHQASQAYKAGNHSLTIRAIASFDVLEDMLDHGPDRNHASASQQQIVAGLPCCSKAEPVLSAVLSTVWTVADFMLPPNQILSGLFRPPRD